MLVKLATRSGLVSHVGMAVAPGDWDNIIRNVILEAERGNHFTIFTNPAIPDVRKSTQIRKFTRAKHCDDLQNIQ